METKNNTGAIFKNDKKTNENQPDYKGKVNVNGKEMEVALWLKTSAKGIKFFSASFSEPFVKSELQNTQITGTLKQVIVKEYGDANDDLPF